MQWLPPWIESWHITMNIISIWNIEYGLWKLAFALDCNIERLSWNIEWIELLVNHSVSSLWEFSATKECVVVNKAFKSIFLGAKNFGIGLFHNGDLGRNRHCTTLVFLVELHMWNSRKSLWGSYRFNLVSGSLALFSWHLRWTVLIFVWRTVYYRVLRFKRFAPWHANYIVCCLQASCSCFWEIFIL